MERVTQLMFLVQVTPDEIEQMEQMIIIVKKIKNSAIGTKQSQDSELLEVLRRANLQRYHKKFYINDIHDPQDVLSAGKDEFTEMMVLVGMASKPEDIKKLKKSLKEWKNEHGGSQIILYF